ncbi:MAG: menaquinone biosynthesis protein [Gemmatimonadetes bacterium]|nr:menaquinone biosynthesis protein [Gemmatimonadota bacterium]MBI3566838.1 menaquinone biosynthesis protein [Gemmatimonadota bacterium]
MRVGRIPYINCYPVYGGVDRGVVPLAGRLVDGVPTALNGMMARGEIDVSVVSAVEYARDWERYLLLPDLAISCDGPVQSVMLFAHRPAHELGGRRVLVSRSSMTSVHLLELLFEHVWRCTPEFVLGDAEASDLHDIGAADARDGIAARLVIGDAALMLRAGAIESPYAHVYDLGEEWKGWTGLPFVFAVWVAQRTVDAPRALGVHGALIESRNWGLQHLDLLAGQAAERTGVPFMACLDYFAGLDYGLSYPHLGGLTEFYRRLTVAGKVPPGRLAFLSAV